MEIGATYDGAGDAVSPETDSEDFDCGKMGCYVAQVAEA